MFDQTIDATLKAIKLIPTNADGDAARVAVLSFAAELTDDVAHGIGRVARLSQAAIKEGDMSQAVLPIDAASFDLQMSDGDNSEHTIADCRGRRATLKVGKGEDSPSIAFEIECRWDDDDLLFLADRNGEALSIRFARRQLSLAVEG